MDGRQSPDLLQEAASHPLGVFRFHFEHNTPYTMLRRFVISVRTGIGINHASQYTSPQFPGMHRSTDIRGERQELSFRAVSALTVEYSVPGKISASLVFGDA